MPRRFAAFLVCLVCTLTFLFNWQFLKHCSLPEVAVMADVSSITNGYQATPHLWADGLRWWHGGWIEPTTPAFRPLASYLCWIDCWVGYHYSFLPAAWLSFLLFVLNCLLATALAWHLTRDRVLTTGTALLAPTVRFFVPQMDADFLKWWPNQPNLLMSALLLGALLLFSRWLTDNAPRRLWGCWAMFITGCLVKEHVYVFPLFAAILTATGLRNARRRGALQTAVMLLVVILLLIYRSHVIPHPYNPQGGMLSQSQALAMYLYNVPTRYALSGGGWMLGLAIGIAILTAVRLRVPRSPLAQTPVGRWLMKPVIFFLLVLVTLGVYCEVACGSLSGPFWFVFDPAECRLPDLGLLLILIYSTWLLVKYRHQAPTFRAWGLFAASYVPIAAFLGWHYALTPWFVRCAFNFFLLGLIGRDLGGRWEISAFYASVCNAGIRVSRRPQT